MGNGILSINSNIVSLRAQRQLAAATDSLSTSFRKLSSGLRVNSASDDAAGLAVASSLKADIRLYSQGVRNLNDGVSVLNIADGAISNLSSIVTRIQELAEQAANGTLSVKQRKSIDDEAQELAEEYFRISHTTTFNGLNLFDGSIQGLSLQAGYGTSGSILSSLGGDLGTGTFAAAVSYQNGSGSAYALSISDLNGDGILDIVTAGSTGGAGYAAIRLGNGDGTFRSALSYQTETGSTSALSLSDVNGDGTPDLVTAGCEFLGAGFASIRLGNGDGTFRAASSYQTESVFSYAISVSDVNGDGVSDLVTAGAGGGSYATIRLGNGDGSFRSALSYRTEGFTTYALSMSDINGDGILDLVTAGTDAMPGPGKGYATIRLGNGDGTFRSALSYETEGLRSSALSMADVNGDEVLDLVTAGSRNLGGAATIRLGNGDGTFRSALSYETEDNGSEDLSMADVDGDGVLDLVTAGSGGTSSATVRLGNGDGTFRSALSYATPSNTSSAVSMADVNNDGVLDMVTAETDPAAYATIRLANTRDGISPILSFSLKTLADARQAIPMLENTSNRLVLQRGQIGAFQSRLSSALNALQTTIIQYSEAESRIVDVDVAEESSTLVRTQILQQVASSVLIQANQTPSIALMLLKG